jgi:membrane protein YdbS with pleckstrin-like domain
VDPAPTPQLRPPRHQVARAAIGYWTLHAALRWVGALVIVGAVIGPSGLDGPLFAALLGAVAVVAVVHTLVMPRWRYAVHRWETTGEAVYTQAGWFDQERRIAPVSRIQTVDSERGPLEQLFGLSTVTVTTASARGPLRIAALDVATADRLVDELTAVAQASPGDAT